MIQFVSMQVFFFCCLLESPSFRLVMKVKCNVRVMVYFFVDLLLRKIVKRYGFSSKRGPFAKTETRIIYLSKLKFSFIETQTRSLAIFSQ